MSERILRALMQLFAIIAHVDELTEIKDEEQEIKSSKGKRIIKSFLRAELSSLMVQKYLDLFDENLKILHLKQQRKDGFQKRTSLNSVKVLRICSQINEELTQKQKIIVLIRIIEFIQSNENISEQEIEFVNTVAESFNISKPEYDLITDFVLSSNVHHIVSPEILHVCPRKNLKYDKCIELLGLDDEIRILQVKSVNIIFFRYFGKDELNLNGQFVFSDRTHIFTHGSTLRTNKSKHLYYSDVISQFLDIANQKKLTFKINNVSFKFKGGKQGLHPFDFTEESGKLVGIMGGSGTGKSTLLNVLNGTYLPSTGNVTINGIDLHNEKDKLQGIIGFVSQDDLLIEELTVFQNLFFNAKLCFANFSVREITRKVIDVLYSIGLYEVKDLVVGNPMDKTISGGQRKRLNIALELIREPEILFVDEPTSGLSSRDSENIMDLLKEMTFRGKLVFVVIHQPSSEIFKMFDRLLLIDQGGYPIFDGNPIDAIVYFKQHVHHGNADERECSVCGNVNPEQLFNIIDTKIVDEYGTITSSRKTTPEEWYQRFNEYKSDIVIEEQRLIPVAPSSIPKRVTQFKVFFLRDLLSKLSNRQYILVTLLEAPILALVLSFFVKYFGNNSTELVSAKYSFFHNENLPQYIFIAVVVALFLGLSVAAEEIHKDKKILKRESFLNLSKGSYLTSKMIILFIISALQACFFVLIGNYILEIKEMWWQYWLVLFSTSCVANVMGLNISSAFNSAKVIYIIVPILIIPQLLFSGVIVKFDKLHPVLSKSTEVPWIGNLMISRWSYEAIAVVQSTENELETKFFDFHHKKFDAAWKKDFWNTEMSQLVSTINSEDKNADQKLTSAKILINEIKQEEDGWEELKCKDCVKSLTEFTTNSKPFNTEEISNYLELLKKHYTLTYNKQNDSIEARKEAIGIEKYNELKNNYTNESLLDIVTNRLEPDKIILHGDQLYRKDNPIYYPANYTSFLGAHFYSPSKNIAGFSIHTFWANIFVLWIFIVALFIALYYDWLRKSLNFMDYWKARLIKK